MSEPGSMCPPPPPPPPPEEEGVSSLSRSPSPKEPEVLEEPTVKPSEVLQREDAGWWDLVECYPLLKQKERLHAVVSFNPSVTQQIHRADCYVISSCLLFIYSFICLSVYSFVNSFTRSPTYCYYFFRYHLSGGIYIYLPETNHV